MIAQENDFQKFKLHITRNTLSICQDCSVAKHLLEIDCLHSELKTMRFPSKHLTDFATPRQTCGNWDQAPETLSEPDSKANTQLTY